MGGGQFSVCRLCGFCACRWFFLGAQDDEWGITGILRSDNDGNYSEISQNTGRMQTQCKEDYGEEHQQHDHGNDHGHVSWVMNHVA